MYFWHYKTFSRLTPHELYAILKLRSEIFVVEQNCVFNDMDDLDPLCTHLFATSAPLSADTLPEVLAATRIVPPGLKRAETAIGRVVVAPSQRGKQLGRELMQRSMQTALRDHPKHNLFVAAQAHLLDFYQSLGFEPTGDRYDEDGIEHQNAICQAGSVLPA